MVPFVLPCILSVAEQATEKEFSAHLLPVLIPLLKITEPVQVSFRLRKRNTWNDINPYPADFIYLNFKSLEVVSHYRDPQPEVDENYSYSFNLTSSI